MTFSNLLADSLLIPVYLLAFLLIGRFLYGRFTTRFTNNFQRNFIEILFGFTISIIFYAIFKTNGNTVFGLMLFLLLWQYVIMKISPDFSFVKRFGKSEIVTIVVCYLFFIFFFIVQLYRYQFFNPDYMRLGWGDYSYYSDIGETFRINGIEKLNNWYDYFNSGFLTFSNNPVPYHYFEIWTHAFLLNFSSAAGVFGFIYVFTPFINMLISASFLALAYTFIKSPSFSKSILLFFSAFVFAFLIGKLPFLAGGWEDNAIHYPRVFMFYLLLVAYIIFYREGFRKEAIFFIGSVSFLNFLYIPTICILLVLLALYQHFVLKEKSEARLSFFTSIFVALTFYLFYYVIFKTESTIKLNLKGLYPIRNYILYGIKYFFRLQLMRVWFFYLPLTAFAVYYLINAIKKKNFQFFRSEIFFIAVFLELISLFFASYVPHLESGTFNSIILNPMLAVFSFMALVYLLKQKTFLAGKLIILMLYGQAIYCFLFVLLDLGIGVYRGIKIGKSFLNEVKEAQINNRIGGFITDKKYFSKFVFANNPNLCGYSSVFDIKGNGYSQVSLCAQIEEDSIPFPEVAGYVTASPMYKYGNYKLTRQHVTDRDSIDLGFVRDYHIEYALLMPGADVPHSLQLQTRKVIKDPVSHISVLYFKE